jgi:hypothetical protein
MMSLDAELRLMSNSWRRFGVVIKINGKNIEEQQLRIPVREYKRQAISGKRQASSFNLTSLTK